METPAKNPRFTRWQWQFCVSQHIEIYVLQTISRERDIDPNLDPMQLVDELSMIYTACLMCYATFSLSQSRAARQFLGLGLASLAIFITVRPSTFKLNSSTDIFGFSFITITYKTLSSTKMPSLSS